MGVPILCGAPSDSMHAEARRIRPERYGGSGRVRIASVPLPWVAPCISDRKSPTDTAVSLLKSVSWQPFTAC